jgi:hypothetical protein
MKEVPNEKRSEDEESMKSLYSSFAVERKQRGMVLDESERSTGESSQCTRNSDVME